MTQRKLEIGGTVIFMDSLRKDHTALVTAIWGEPEGREAKRWVEGEEDVSKWPTYTEFPCINLLFVTHDESRTDQYGRQIDRQTSIVHQGLNSAGGFCYRFLDEDPVVWETPVK